MASPFHRGPTPAVQNRPPVHPGVAIASVCLSAAALLASPGLLGSRPGNDGSVMACGLHTSRIEDVFATSGVLHLNGMDYRLSDGIFKSLHGARAWVAVTVRSSKASAHATRPVLVERDGQVLIGTLRAIASQHANLQQSQVPEPEIQI